MIHKKIILKTLLIVGIISCSATNSFSRTFSSVSSGDWTNTATWGGVFFPNSSNDTVIINLGHIVNFNVIGTSNYASSLHIKGVLNFSRNSNQILGVFNELKLENNSDVSLTGNPTFEHTISVRDGSNVYLNKNKWSAEKNVTLKTNAINTTPQDVNIFGNGTIGRIYLLQKTKYHTNGDTLRVTGALTGGNNSVFSIGDNSFVLIDSDQRMGDNIKISIDGELWIEKWVDYSNFSFPSIDYSNDYDNDGVIVYDCPGNINLYPFNYKNLTITNKVDTAFYGSYGLNHLICQNSFIIESNAVVCLGKGISTALSFSLNITDVSGDLIIPFGSFNGKTAYINSLLKINSSGKFINLNDSLCTVNISGSILCDGQFDGGKKPIYMVNKNTILDTIKGNSPELRITNLYLGANGHNIKHSNFISSTIAGLGNLNLIKNSVLKFDGVYNKISFSNYIGHLIADTLTKVVYTATSTIDGILLSNSGYFNLELNILGDLVYNSNLDIRNNLNFINGSILLGDNRTISFRKNSLITGYSQNSYIKFTNTPGNIKFYTNNNLTNYFFPIGTSSDQSYTPINLNINYKLMSPSASISVQLNAKKHPYLLNTTNYIKRYWNVTSNGIDSLTAIINYYYNDLDIVGDESKINSLSYNGIDWHIGQASNIVNNNLTYTGVIENNDLTGGCEGKPIIYCPSDIISYNDRDTCGAFINLPNPDLSANCKSGLILNLSHQSGAFFPIGNTTVNYTVSDTFGLQSGCSFNILVIDSQAPEIISAPPLYLYSCSNTVSWDDVVFKDNCVIDSLYKSHNSPNTFLPNSTNNIIYKAYSNGKVKEYSFSISIGIDSIKPSIIGCPNDTNIWLTDSSCSLNVNWKIPIASDDCGIKSFNSNYQPNDLFGAGNHFVNYTAIDSSNNISICSFKVSIDDTIKPNLIVGDDILMYSDSNNCGTFVSINDPIITDNCGVASLLNNYTNNSNASSFYPVGKTKILWTAIDINGNISQDTQIVNIIDTIKPKIYVPNLVSSCSPITAISYSVYENCGSYSLSQNPPQGSLFPIGQTVVHFTVTDLSGNTSYAQTIVKINELPKANAGKDTSICPGDSIFIGGLPTAISGTPPYSFNWFTDVNNKMTSISNLSNPFISPSNTKTYTIFVTDSNGCSGNDEVTIVVNSLPTGIVSKGNEQKIDKTHPLYYQTQNSTEFGASLESCDFNNDGISDLIIGAPKDNAHIAGPNYLKHFGAIYINLLDSNGNTIEVKKICEDGTNFNNLLSEKDYFGSSIAQIGDIDNNGVIDLAVGAPGDDNLNVSGKNHGAVWILFMNSDGTIKSKKKLYSLNNGIPVTFSPGDAFGSSIAYLGDMNNDGFIEIAVGIPGKDHTISKKDRGAVAILTLNSDSANLGEVTYYFEINSYNFPQLNTQAYFGNSIASTGDINEDGINDLIVGAPYMDSYTSNGSKILNTGAIFVFFMDNNRSPKISNGVIDTVSFVQISPGYGGMPGLPYNPLNNETYIDIYDQFGASISNVGLFNDCEHIIAVGSPFDDEPNPYIIGGNRGSVYILRLKKDGFVRDYGKIGPNNGNFNGLVVPDAYFGSDIARVDDMDNDGIPEIAVGAMNDGSDGIQRWGSVFLIKTTDQQYNLNRIMNVNLDNHNTDQYYNELTMNIFPNPASTNLTVLIHNSLSKSNEKLSLDITSITGQIIYATELNGKSNDIQLSIDVNEFPKGMYFIKLTQSETMISKKIIFK